MWRAHHLTRSIIGGLRVRWGSIASTPVDTFDLVVIGSGPAAQKCAINAAKLRQRVAVVDRKAMLGGVCVHTGTIPSKTFREAVLYLTGYRQRGFYGKDHMEREQIDIQDILDRVHKVEGWETEIVFDQLRRNGIAVLSGMAAFEDQHHLRITSDPDFDSEIDDMIVRAENVLIATGTRPARNPLFPFDGNRVFDSDQILKPGWTLPKDLIVVGSGVIAIEYASMLNALPGIRVTIIDGRPEILGFVDQEILDALKHSMRASGASFRLGESIKNVTVEKDRVCVTLDSNKRVRGDALLYAVGRQGNTDSLNLEATGVIPNKRGLLEVNENYQTSVSHIYAAGDVIGFPALASTAMEQGRISSNHMFGVPVSGFPKVFPFGIYTIPEISMVGQSEAELTANRVPYEIGVARFDELAKGQMLGLQDGLVKILFCPDTLKLLGVHAIGENATEIIHIGQILLSMDGKITYFRDNVFNYPTFAEAYRVAALDGLGRLK